MTKLIFFATNSNYLISIYLLPGGTFHNFKLRLIHKLKYQTLTILGCENIGIRKSKFVPVYLSCFSASNKSHKGLKFRLGTIFCGNSTERNVWNKLAKFL